VKGDIVFEKKFKKYTTICSLYHLKYPVKNSKHKGKSNNIYFFLIFLTIKAIFY